MNAHWEKGLNIKSLLLSKKPRHILEIGCLEGQMTENILSLQSGFDFKLTCISDDLEMKSDGVRRIRGVSYREIPKLEDGEFDFAIIDTDHNYWTLERELAELHRKLAPEALVVIHDVEYFYYNTGIAVADSETDTYADESAYPLKEITECAAVNGGMALAVIDALSKNRFSYKLVTWISEGVGICLLQKTPREFPVLTIAPVYPGHNSRKGSRNELDKVPA